MANPPQQFDQLFASLRRDPANADLRAAMQHWLDQQPQAFDALVPPHAFDFGIAPSQQPRRRQFLQHLLLHGYLPPRVEEQSTTYSDATINLGVITGYFYSHALSLLEAGLLRPDMAILVAYPAPAGSEPWIEQVADGTGRRIFFRRALMLDQHGLVWRHFRDPVPIHYLFPVDNYYRSKFRLVTDYNASGVPMPGSLLIREVCENKALLGDMLGQVASIRLAREIILEPGDARVHAEQLDAFCTRYLLHHLVSKPPDGFGGMGVEFWDYPTQREALLARIEQVLKEHATILVQERIIPVPTRSGHDWNLRQYVVREGPALIRAPWKRARIGHGAVNTTQGAQSTTLEDLLADIDLAPAQRERFLATLDRTERCAIDVLQAVEDYLQRRWGEARIVYRGSGSNLEPDLLALDFMIGHDPQRPGEFVVYLNEINDFASGGMRDYEILRHRQMLPDAIQVQATQPFSLAPAMLQMAFWRGSAYRQALLDA